VVGHGNLAFLATGAEQATRFFAVYGCYETWMLGILGLQWLIWDTLKSSSIIQHHPAFPSVDDQVGVLGDWHRRILHATVAPVEVDRAWAAAI